MPRGSSLTSTVLRTIAAFAAIVAIAVQIHQTVERGTPLFHALGFFTIQSNAFAAFALLAAPFQPRLRGPAAVYLSVTAIVYALVLGGLPATLSGTISWDNVVLHEAVPAMVVADWWFDPSPLLRPVARLVVVWLVYPLCYLMSTLLIGARTGWYPYGFLAASHIGYPAVAVVSVILTLFAAGIAIVYARRAPPRLSLHSAE